MSGRRLLLAAAGLSMGVAGVAGAPAPAAVGEVVRAHTAVEAWHTAPVAAPACDTASALCPAPLLPAEPPASPPSTLHVGVANGAETDRTFLVLDLTGLPDDAEPVAGVLVLPLADPHAGAAAPEAAALLACAVQEAVQPASGAVGPGPSFDCATSSSGLYMPPAPGREAGAFVVDLAPFLQDWAAGEAPALALVAAPSSLGEPTAAWHLAFAGRQTPEGPSPIGADIEVAPRRSLSTTTTEPVGMAPDSEPGPWFDAAPMVPALPSSPGRDVSPEPRVEQLREAASRADAGRRLFGPSGFAYPLLFVLPLVFVVLFGVLSRSLVADIPRRTPSAS